MRREPALALVASLLLVLMVAAVQLRERQDEVLAPHPGANRSRLGTTSPGDATGRPGPHRHRGQGHTSRVSRDQVRLTFDALPAGRTAPPRLGNQGHAHVRVWVITADGGRAVVTRGMSGRALRLPGFRPGAIAPPRAAVRITNSTSTDELDPGTRPFEFGATVRLFARSEGERLVDNGNNLMQRGLATEPAQYKIELDGRVPTCRIKGTAGVVTAYSPVVLDPGGWYSIACRRNGPEVSVRVVHLRPGPAGGPLPGGQPDVVSTYGIIGSLRAGDPRTPLSVGGKFYPTGRLDSSATDQLNGVVDEAFLRIG